MITKELAQELIEDLGYNVSNPLQYFQKAFTVDESQIPADGYIYCGYFTVNSPSSIIDLSGIYIEGKIKNNSVLFLQCAAGVVSVGQNGFSTLSVPPVFAILDQIDISGEAGALNFCGYRMKI